MKVEEAGLRGTCLKSHLGGGGGVLRGWVTSTPGGRQQL